VICDRESAIGATLVAARQDPPPARGFIRVMPRSFAIKWFFCGKTKNLDLPAASGILTIRGFQST